LRPIPLLCIMFNMWCKWAQPNKKGEINTVAETLQPPKNHCGSREERREERKEEEEERREERREEKRGEERRRERREKREKEGKREKRRRGRQNDRPTRWGTRKPETRFPRRLEQPPHCGGEARAAGATPRRCSLPIGDLAAGGRLDPQKKWRKEPTEPPLRGHTRRASPKENPPTLRREDLAVELKPKTQKNNNTTKQQTRFRRPTNNKQTTRHCRIVEQHQPKGRDQCDRTDTEQTLLDNCWVISIGCACTLPDVHTRHKCEGIPGTHTDTRECSNAKMHRQFVVELCREVRRRIFFFEPSPKWI